MARRNESKGSRRAQRRQEAIRRAKVRRRLQVVGGGFVVGLLVVGLLTLSGGSGGNTAVAAEFELEQLDGETVKLSDFRGSPVAITFMHSW